MESVSDGRIGDALRARRVELGWSQRQCGEAIAVSAAQWAKFEEGRNRISAPQLRIACEAMGLSADEVLGLRPSPRPPEASELDEQARSLMQVFRDLPHRLRRELLKAARQMQREAPAPAE